MQRMSDTLKNTSESLLGWYNLRAVEHGVRFTEWREREA